MPKQFDIEVWSITDKGLVKGENEDSILICEGQSRSYNYNLLAVADGVGGSELGKEASRYAVSRLEKWKNTFLSPMIAKGCSWDEIKKHCRTEFELINLSIFEQSKQYRKSMATTLSMLLVIDREGELLHIGDSRIYRIRGKRTELLTEDHTWVAAQIQKGSLSREQARTHKNRHAITRCLGKAESCVPYQTGIRIKANDIYLICSDGFYEYFDEFELNQRFIGKPSEVSYGEVLDSMAKEIYMRGAHDNLSAILIKVKRTLIWKSNKKDFKNMQEELDEENTQMVEE